MLQPLQSSDPATASLFAVVFALPFSAIGGYVAYRGLSSVRHGVTLWRSDPTTVLDAANASGTVELVGTADVAEQRVLRSPFEDERCLAYEWTVEEYDESGDDGDWDTLESGREQVPFRLEDDTGSILVEPEGAELALADGETVEVGRGETAGEPIQSFLASIGVEPGEGSEASLGPVSVSTGDRRRYREQRLDVGETVHVYGPVEHDLDAAEGSGDVNAAVREGAGDGLFLVSDTEASSTVLRTLGGGILVTCFGLLFVGAGLYVGASSLVAGLLAALGLV